MKGGRDEDREGRRRGIRKRGEGKKKKERKAEGRRGHMLEAGS